MLIQTTSRVIPSATSSEESEDGATPCVSRVGPMTDLFGQVPAPASRSVQRALSEAARIKDTFGRHGKRSLKSAALQRSLESKLEARLPSDGWTKPFLIWRKMATPAQRQYCLLFVDRKAMNATGFGLWHTPRTLMIMEDPEKFRARMNSKRPKDRKNGLPNLAVQARWASSNVPMGCSAKLNPQFLCWLMGYTEAWTRKLTSVTRSSLKSPPSSLPLL